MMSSHHGVVGGVNIITSSGFVGRFGDGQVPTIGLQVPVIGFKMSNKWAETR